MTTPTFKPSTVYAKAALDLPGCELPPEPLIPFGAPMLLLDTDTVDALVSYYGLKVVVALEWLSDVPPPGDLPPPPGFARQAEALAARAVDAIGGAIL